MTLQLLSLSSWFDEQKSTFILNFVNDHRYRYIIRGIKITLEVTVFALVLGLALGIITAIVRASYDKNKDTKFSHSFGGHILGFFNFIFKVYLTVIRGTPTLIQLMIMFFVIFGSSSNKILAAILAFGINSGAYVAEIIRSGIMSIDEGQFEAGRSLGFNYAETMIYIILPQAFKNVLPALGNEFITLLKETSVSGYIGLSDLTKGADIIRSRTYTAYMPLFSAALIYLVFVMILTFLLSKLERRLRNSDH